MSVTYGFYNAQDHDRLYNAEQVAQLFDGLISNGVYQSIGNAMVVKANGGMSVTVGTGRAWFNHTWTLNDAIYPITLDASQSIVRRIDAVVLEIDARRDYRRNQFTVVKGTPTSGTPQKPALTNTDSVHQYPLAWITIGTDVVNITQANIENAVGTSSCPFVTGIVQQMSIDALVAQWQAQWTAWLDDFETNQMNDFTQWVAERKALMLEYAAEEKEYIDSVVQDFEDWEEDQKQSYLTWSNARKQEFDDWFANLSYVLDGDVAAHLQNEIDTTKGSVLKVVTTQSELYGTTVRLTGPSGTYLSKIFDNSGIALFEGFIEVGELIVSADDGYCIVPVEVPYYGNYTVNITAFRATVNIHLVDQALWGSDITIVGNALNVTIPSDASGEAVYVFKEPGTYRFSVEEPE